MSCTPPPQLPMPVCRNGANSPIHHGGLPFLVSPLQIEAVYFVWTQGMPLHRYQHLLRCFNVTLDLLRPPRLGLVQIRTSPMATCHSRTSPSHIVARDLTHTWGPLPHWIQWILVVPSNIPDPSYPHPHLRMTKPNYLALVRAITLYRLRQTIGPQAWAAYEGCWRSPSLPLLKPWKSGSLGTSILHYSVTILLILQLRSTLKWLGSWPHGRVSTMSRRGNPDAQKHL
jgi:hypothetical protein